MIVFNHLAYVDAPLLFSAVDRHDFIGLVAKKYQKTPFFRWLVEKLSGIWLDRENPDPKALRLALRHLQGGGMLGIAPEGTRSKNMQMLKAKPGASYLATKAEVAIVPVAISGTETTWNDLLKLRRPHYNLQFGSPFTLPQLDPKDKEGSLKKNADAIMCRIALMLPEKYRGVYATHPLLLELRKEDMKTLEN